MASRLVPVKRKIDNTVRPTNLIDRIQREMRTKGYAARTTESRQWLLGLHGQLRPNTTRLVNSLSSTTKQVPDVRPGFMYHFYYDPKYKKELPYYDRFPLIICIKKVPGGFYGLNLHYLPPMQRAYLLSKLEAVASNRQWDENTKLVLSYKLLSSYGKFAEFRPCFKRYLMPHVHSAFLFIPASAWDIAVFLPTERFEKKRKTQIWYGR
jgi:hypothetical protein